MLSSYSAFFYILDSNIVIRDVSLTSVVGSSESHKSSQFLPHPDLSVRQARILDLCERMGAVTNKEVCEAFEVSEVTAGRDLSEMVSKGLLQRVGKGRATSYTKV